MDDTVGWAHKIDRNRGIILLHHHVNAGEIKFWQICQFLSYPKSDDMTETFAIDIWSLYKATDNSQAYKNLLIKAINVGK